MIAVPLVTRPSPRTPLTTPPSSSFSLDCHFTDYYGELEETAWPMNATVVGVGCNGSNVTVTEDIVFSFTSNNKKRHKTPMQHCRSSETTTISAGTVISHNSTHLGIRPIMKNSTVQHKKDIDTFPEAKIVFNEFFVISGEGFSVQQENELYIPTDNDNNFLLSFPMFQVNLYFTYDIATTNFNVWFLDSLFPPECVDTMITNYYPVALRFDHEAGKYVVVLLNSGAAYMCVAVSDTSDPNGSWGVITFESGVFTTYQSALEFGIWKDYYNICWLENTAGQEHCLILQRNETLSLLGAKIVFVADNLFPIDNMARLNVPAVHPLHQGLSARATFAPCGVFSIANDQRQQLQVAFCDTVDFDTGTATFTLHFMNTSWTSGWDYPCNTVLNGGCIVSADYPSQPLQPFSNRLRMAYYNYGLYEKLAYVWQTDLGMGPTKLLWGEMFTTDLGNPTITPSVLGADSYYYFAPQLMYDCRETLFLTFTQTSNTTSIKQDFTYRLRTDPPDQLRNPPLQIDYSVYQHGFPTTPNWLMPYVFPNTLTPRTARFSTTTHWKEF